MNQRIAIFRALYIGDLLLAVPALRSIRACFPDAEITLIGLPWAKSFARRFERYIDRFVEFAGYPGIKEVEFFPERTRRFLAEQRAYGYDLVIQMHGSGLTSNRFALALGARKTVGYYSETPPAGLTLSAPYPDDCHEVYRNLGLAAMLGCPRRNPRLEFPLFAEERAEARTLLHQLPRADRPWIGLHAGSHSPARRWPAQYFARVADILARRFGAQIVLTGSQDEVGIVQAVAECMETQALNVAGKTSLGGLATVIDEMDLFISNDTGPAHIANALDTLSVTIFGPADPRRWAALDQARHPIVRRPVVCSPCDYSECPIDHQCLRGITPEMVIEVAEKLLSKGVGAMNCAPTECSA